MNLRRVQSIGILCALFCATFICQASQPTALVSWGTEFIPPLAADTKFKAIASGRSHNLAIRLDDTVVAWGADHDGQCRVPAGLSDVVAVAAGGSYSLALKSDGTVVGWGFDASGVISTPVGLTNVVAIAAAYSHSLALKADGTVVSSWTNVPVPEGLSNVVAIAAGSSNDRSLALKADGTVVIWGNGITPATIASNIVAITHSLGLKDDGTVVGLGGIGVPEGLGDIVAITSSFGLTEYLQHIVLRADGKTGTFSTSVSSGAPSNFGSFSYYYGSNIVSIAAGSSHILRLNEDGTLAVNGNGDYSQSVLPTEFNDVTAIAAGYRHQVVLKKDGTIRSWGEGYAGQLYVPLDLTNAVAVAAGAAYTAALRSNGRLFVEGSLVGKNSIFTGVTNLVALAGGDFHAVFLDANGKVWTCGINTDGQQNIPAGLTNVVAIAAGQAHSVALRADGTAIAWGKISQDFTNYNDIVAVDASMLLRANGDIIYYGRGEHHMPPVGNAAAVSSGRYHEIVLIRDGKVISGGFVPLDLEHNQTYVAPEVKHVLAIEAGWGKSFAIVSIAPELRSQMAGENLMLSWPVSTKNYILQTTSDVSAVNSWVAAEGEVVVENHRNIYTVPATVGQRFFRLVQVAD